MPVVPVNPFVGAQPDPELPEPEIVAEPITGWRAWSLVPPPESLTLSRETLAKMAAAHEAGENPFVGLFPPTRLGSLGMGQIPWEAEMEARCLAAQSAMLQMRYVIGPVSEHEAPNPACACGLWALRSQDALARQFPGGLEAPYAFGEVQLWGRVVEFDRGYRAQFARPVRVWVVGGTHEQEQEIADYYGCEVLKAADIPGRPEAQAQLEKASADVSSYSSFLLQMQPSMAKSFSQSSALLSMMPPPEPKPKPYGFYALLLAAMAGVNLGAYIGLGYDVLNLIAFVVLGMLSGLPFGLWLAEKVCRDG